jgi:hypothetical protein
MKFTLYWSIKKKNKDNFAHITASTLHDFKTIKLSIGDI